MTTTRGRPRHEDLLTPREWQVIDLLEQGLTNEQIADSLQISFGGAKFHVAEIISKLGAQDRHEAVRLARGGQAGRIGLLGLALLQLPELHLRPRPTAAVAAGTVLLVSLAAWVLIFNSWLPWLSATRPGDEALGEAIADFEPGNAEGQELGQAQFDPSTCVTGEEARNRRYMGRVMPAGAAFNSIEEAERWLCIRLPRPRSADLIPYPGGRIDNGPLAPVLALRPQDIEILISPENAGGDHGRASVYFRSTRPGGKIIVFEILTGGLRPMAGFTTEAVRVQGTEGQLLMESSDPNSRAMVVWEKDGYGFIASMHRLQDFGLKEFLAILETVS